MNSLTIFLYLADVLQNIGGVLFAISLISFIVTSGTVLYCLLEGENLPKFLVFSTIVAVIFAFLAALIPEPKTMYLMAGSEVGEMVVTSEEGKAVISDVRDAIRQLSSPKEEK